jgi:hypothetical protein
LEDWPLGCVEARWLYKKSLANLGFKERGTTIACGRRNAKTALCGPKSVKTDPNIAPLPPHVTLAQTRAFTSIWKGQ